MLQLLVRQAFLNVNPLACFPLASVPEILPKGGAVRPASDGEWRGRLKIQK